MSVGDEILQGFFSQPLEPVLVVTVYAEAESAKVLVQFFKDEFGEDADPTTPFMDGLAGLFIHGMNDMLRRKGVKAHVATAALDLGAGKAL